MKASVKSTLRRRSMAVLRTTCLTTALALGAANRATAS